MAKVKTCSQCKRSLPLAEYPKDSRHADGRGSYCRPCAAERTQAWRERSRKNREKHREWNREYMRRRRGAA